MVVLAELVRVVLDIQTRILGNKLGFGALLIVALTFAVFNGFFCKEANAEYVKSCKIAYVNTGKTYDVTCHIMSGEELNNKTSSFDYDMFDTYSVVFWGNRNATVIKIDDFVVCGMKPEFDCANSFLPIDGTDKDGRKWKICNQSDLFCD
jgi:hypothetical protein